ncbi:MAG: YbaK/EbsC family protein [Ruminococcaceae bacterium]|nr:YbaK/EbsC family protein [Oscillospiraceae bacterium]
MSIEKAKAYLAAYGMADKVIEFEQSSATVELAAQALGCEPSHIAKSILLQQPEGVVMILAAGDGRIDNRKFKDHFGVKPKMMPFDLVEEAVGHAPGGVCPFGIHDGVAVYLDESLRRFDVVYPAAGSGNSAIPMTTEELERVSQAIGWVDVCKSVTV